MENVCTAYSCIEGLGERTIQISVGSSRGMRENNGEEKRREGTECAKSGRERSRMRESRGKKKKVAKLQEEVLNNGASYPRTIRSSFHFSLRLPPPPPSPHAPFHLRLPSPHASTTPSPFPSILLFMLPKPSNTLRFAPQ